MGWQWPADFLLPLEEGNEMIEKSGLIHYSSYRGKVSHVILSDSETPTYWGDSKQKCVWGIFPENVFSESVAAFIIFSWIITMKRFVPESSAWTRHSAWLWSCEYWPGSIQILGPFNYLDFDRNHSWNHPEFLEDAASILIARGKKRNWHPFLNILH